MVTFTINIPPMLAYIPYMDPMGICIICWITVLGHGDFHITVRIFLKPATFRGMIHGGLLVVSFPRSDP
jgi:hypothetical protein